MTITPAGDRKRPRRTIVTTKLWVMSLSIAVTSAPTLHMVFPSAARVRSPDVIWTSWTDCPKQYSAGRCYTGARVRGLRGVAGTEDSAAAADGLSPGPCRAWQRS